MLNHLVEQELLLNVGGHCVPDGCSLWKSKGEPGHAPSPPTLRSTPNIPPTSHEAVADAKCHGRPPNGDKALSLGHGRGGCGWPYLQR